MTVLASFTSGDAAQWAAVAVALLFAWRVTRGGGGSAVQELSEANKVLTARKDELGAQVRDLLVENRALRERTDFGAVMDGHERRAQERHEATLKVLDLIAARLGPGDGPPVAHAKAA